MPTLKEEGGLWIVEVPASGGGLQRFECTNRRMADNLMRALARLPAGRRAS